MLMILGYFYHYLQEQGQRTENHALQKMMTGLIVVGGYGFLLMFYLAGAAGVPRRFAVYPQEVAHGAPPSLIAVGFSALFCVGLALYVSEIGKCWFKAARS